jgi:hypothetical protein
VRRTAHARGSGWAVCSTDPASQNWPLPLMGGCRRLQAVACALRCPVAATAGGAAPGTRRPPEPEWDSAGDEEGDAVLDSNASLTLAESLFVFDLQGVLVIEDVLEPATVDELNRLIDAQGIAPGTPEVLADGSEGSRVRFGSSGGGSRNTGPGLLEWGQPFVDLLDHPAILPFLAALMPRQDGLGTASAGIRLDRLYGIHQDQNSSGILPTGTGLGGFHRDFEGTFNVTNGTFQNSFIVAAWALSDSGGDAGGFVCFPGSHKQNFPLPESFRKRKTVLPPGAISPRIKKGSLVLFTEALTQ